MDIKLGINLLPRFVPGEKVLYLKSWVWAASFKSLPTYRWFFSLPPLWEAGAYVTDKRLVLPVYLLRLIVMEHGFWFDAVEGGEQMKSVEIKSVPVLGKCVEIVSEDPVKHWYRSRELRTRLYMREPEPLYEVISQMITAQQ